MEIRRYVVSRGCNPVSELMDGQRSSLRSVNSRIWVGYSLTATVSEPEEFPYIVREYAHSSDGLENIRAQLLAKGAMLGIGTH